jgi:hypothetical protein
MESNNNNNKNYFIQETIFFRKKRTSHKNSVTSTLCRITDEKAGPSGVQTKSFAIIRK